MKTRKRVSRILFGEAGPLFPVVFGVFTLIFVVIFRGIYNYLTHSSYIIRTSFLSFLSHLNSNIAFFAISLLIGLLAFLFYVSREVIYGVLFLPLSDWRRKTFLILLRLLSSLPTLIIGNAVLSIALFLNIHPAHPLSMWLFLLLAFSMMALPVTIPLGFAILSNYDRRQLEEGQLSGLTKLQTARNLIFPSYRAHFNSALTFALSRIFFEAYIVMRKGELFKDGFKVNNAQDMLEIFERVYSSTTIGNNIPAIIILFALSLFLTYLITFNLLGTQHQ